MLYKFVDFSVFVGLLVEPRVLEIQSIRSRLPRSHPRREKNPRSHLRREAKMINEEEVLEWTPEPTTTVEAGARSTTTVETELEALKREIATLWERDRKRDEEDKVRLEEERKRLKDELEEQKRRVKKS